MDNMLNSVLRREINRQRAVIPFCIRHLSETAQSSSEKSTDKLKEPKLEENPYFSKYADKIRKAQSALSEPSKGQDEPNEQRQMKEEMKKFEARMAVPRAGYDPGPKSTPSGSTRPKNLGDIVHMDLLLGHGAEEIEKIWKKYHSSKENTLFAVVPSECYNSIYELATQYPLFLYPLPRSDKAPENLTPESEGYEFFLGQFSGHSFYFTPVVLYQRYGESAPPCLVINHFPELSSTKKIVLMNGEYDSNALGIAEAQCLANQIKLFYDGQDLRKKILLHAFNKDQKAFNHEDLIKEFEGSLLKTAAVLKSSQLSSK
ncbi:ATP synthase mitochondrial F1 complex assembly factor 1 [Halotydeus destructor]|nr:ATP synthase mitochondrial F1 complex assembly factor 1 [Halotydeus destructor]